MKNMVKLFGLIALVTVIGLSMAACKNDDDGGNGNTENGNTENGNTGSTINGGSIVSGAPVDYPVRTPEEAKSQTDFSYFEGYYSDGDYYDTPTPISTYIDQPASVIIKNGKLDIKLGTPKPAYLEKIIDYHNKGVDNLAITPIDAKWFGFENDIFTTSDGSYLLLCMKSDADFVILVYADKNVTIKGKVDYKDYSGSVWVYDVSLKQGWNYMIVSEGTTITLTSASTLPDGYKWTVLSN